MSFHFEIFESSEQIEYALDIIRYNRLGRPGDGIITLMSRREKPYDINKIIIAFCIETLKPIGCLVLDRRKTYKGWYSFSENERIPNDYLRVNVWVKPDYRKNGAARKMLEISCIEQEYGVECYDSGKASRKLYSNLKDARIV